MRLSKHVLITLCASIYAVLALYGVYGFGTDYYSSYQYPSNSTLGYYLVTLHFDKLPVGIAFTSFLLAYSFGQILLVDSRKYCYQFPLISYLIFLHSWPLIMLSLNVSRQGLATGFLYLSIYLIIIKKDNFSLFSIFLTFLLHRTSIIMIPVYIISKIMMRIKSKSVNLMLIFYTTSSLILFSAVLFYKHYIHLADDNITSRVIGGDFSPFFIFTNFFVIIIFLSKIKSAANDFIFIIIFFFK